MRILWDMFQLGISRRIKIRIFFDMFQVGISRRITIRIFNTHLWALRSGLHPSLSPSPSHSRPEDCDGVPAMEQHCQAQAASVPACPLRSGHVCSQCS